MGLISVLIGVLVIVGSLEQSVFGGIVRATRYDHKRVVRQRCRRTAAGVARLARIGKAIEIAS